ncbi:MAG: hypothetical protein ACFCD0_10265 [Gemmataceae bacterium]
MDKAQKTLWELLWNYDPNGLVAMDEQMQIQVVNPAFCRMFQVEAATVMGTPAEHILGDVSDFRHVQETGAPLVGVEKTFPELDLHVRQMIYTVREENILAGVMVDLSTEHQQRQERAQLKQRTIEKVHEVVNHQMKVAQEIAGLLGETTAETKASLFKLIRVIEEEM